MGSRAQDTPTCPSWVLGASSLQREVSASLCLRPPRQCRDGVGPAELPLKLVTEWGSRQGTTHRSVGPSPARTRGSGRTLWGRASFCVLSSPLKPCVTKYSLPQATCWSSGREPQREPGPSPSRALRVPAVPCCPFRWRLQHSADTCCRMADPPECVTITDISLSTSEA